MTTKAERIRQLLADEEIRCETKATQERIIANLVGCRAEYVRVVKQRLDPARRALDAAAIKAVRQTSDGRLVQRAWAIHYYDARAKGMNWREANKVAARARSKAEHATADRAAARAAYHAAKRGTANA